MPSRLNAFAANTTNVSRVIAKIAGIESIANITSKTATMTRADCGRGRRPAGEALASTRIASVLSGSTCSPLRAIFTAVYASSAPSTYVIAGTGPAPRRRRR